MKRALMVAILICGCSSSSSSSSSNNKAAEQACLDTADAIGKAEMRCGQDYKVSYDAFVQAAAHGSCTNVVQVRDEASLRSVCLPAFAQESCSDLLAGKYDPTCKGQLERLSSIPQSVTSARFEGVASEQ